MTVPEMNVLPFPAFFLSENTYLILLEYNKALIKKDRSTIADYLLSNKSQWSTVLLSILLLPSPFPFYSISNNTFVKICSPESSA